MTTAKWLGMAALAGWLAPAAAAQSQPAQKAPVPMQRQGATSTQKPAAPAQKPAAAPAKKPVVVEQKPAAVLAKKPVAPTQKPAARTTRTKKAANPGANARMTKVSAKVEPPVRRRDPFEPLVSKKSGSGEPVNLPPGKAGLLISNMRIVGAVQGPNGSIAIVSNPQERVYFLHEGDHVYDGRVEKIALDGVVFRQTAKDAFGKVVDRTVTKRIYPSAGEQQ